MTDDKEINVSRAVVIVRMIVAMIRTIKMIEIGMITNYKSK